MVITCLSLVHIIFEKGIMYHDNIAIAQFCSYDEDGLSHDHLCREIMRHWVLIRKRVHYIDFYESLNVIKGNFVKGWFMSKLYRWPN